MNSPGNALAVIFILPLFVPQSFGQEEKETSKPLLVRELANHVRMRLVAVQRSNRRGGNLNAQFAPVDVAKNEATKAFATTFPSHSFTVHETTLLAVIRHCAPPARPDAPHEWRKVTAVNADFLIPAKPKSNFYEDWVLLSITPVESAKKSESLPSSDR